MNKFLENVRNRISEWNQNLSTGEKTRLILLALVVVAVVCVGVYFLNATGGWEIIYNDLSTEDSNSVIRELNNLKEKYKTQNSGATILVPSERADEVRFALADANVLKEPISFAVYNSLTGFSATDEQKRYAEEYQISRTIERNLKAAPKIEDAYVDITLAEKGKYVLSNGREASASVTVTTKDGGKLSKSEAAGIARLVQGYVSGLKLENISFMDTNLNSYVVTEEIDEDEDLLYTTRLRMKKEMNSTYEEGIYNLLRPAFGIDGIHVSVNTTLNFDKESTSETIFEPPVEGADEGLAVSYEKLYEFTRDSVYNAGEPGVDPNSTVPGYMEAISDAGTYYYSVSEKANMEFNERKSIVEKEQGSVESIGVSVTVDSNIDGIEDYIADIQELVSGYLSINQRFVSVKALPMQTEQKDLNMVEYLKSLERQEQIKDWIKYGIILFLTILVLLMLYMMFRTSAPKPVLVYEEIEAETEPSVTLTGEAGLLEALEESEEETPESIRMRGEEDALRQIKEFIAENPEAAARLFQTWLIEEDE